MSTSIRSSSYHSPTRCNSPISLTQQQANAISRPNSPAASSRHSTYSDRERSGSGHHTVVSRTPSHNSQKSIEGDVIVVREPHLERRDSTRNAQERSGSGSGAFRDHSDCVQLSSNPGGDSCGNSAAALPTLHNRTNSGPTISIGMIKNKFCPNFCDLSHVIYLYSFIKQL